MSTPTDKAEGTAIDAEVMEAIIALIFASHNEGYIRSITTDDKAHADAWDITEAAKQILISAVQSEKTEGEHYLRHFTKLAKVNAAANAALDTARREWAKKVEGK